MIKKYSKFLGVLLTLALLLAVLPAGAAQADGSLVLNLTLQESTDLTNWNKIPGSLEDGFFVGLDPSMSPVEMKYLDVHSLTATLSLKDGRYGFFIDTDDAPEHFWAYWTGQDVVDGATGWQGIMWSILKGDKPIFYIDVSTNGTAFKLVDGL